MSALTTKRHEIDTLTRDAHQARERLEASERHLADAEARRKTGHFTVADVEAIRATVETRRHELDTAERDLKAAEAEAATLAESVPETDLSVSIRDATTGVHALRAEVDQRIADLETQLGATARDILEAQHEARRLLSIAKRSAQQLAEVRGTTVASEYARAVEGTDVQPLGAQPAPPSWPSERRGAHADLASLKAADLASRYTSKA